MLSARWVLQTMVNGSDSWCLSGRHGECSERTRGALSAGRHGHLSVPASDTARVDTAAVVGSSSVGVAIRWEKHACGRKHVCIVQVDANALMVAAPFYDLVAACLLSLSVCLVVIFIVCSSPWSMCLPSLSGCLVCLLGFLKPGGRLSVGCHLKVESRNGLHGIWLYFAVLDPGMMCRT